MSDDYFGAIDEARSRFQMESDREYELKAGQLKNQAKSIAIQKGQLEATKWLNKQMVQLAKDKLEEEIRQFDLTFGEGVRQFDLRFGEDVRQFNTEATGEIFGAPTWQRQYQTAGLTGFLDGQPTMDRQQLESQTSGYFRPSGTLSEPQRMRYDTINTRLRELQAQGVARGGRAGLSPEDERELELYERVISGEGGPQQKTFEREQFEELQKRSGQQFALQEAGMTGYYARPGQLTAAQQDRYNAILAREAQLNEHNARYSDRPDEFLSEADRAELNAYKNILAGLGPDGAGPAPGTKTFEREQFEDDVRRFGLQFAENKRRFGIEEAMQRSGITGYYREPGQLTGQQQMRFDALQGKRAQLESVGQALSPAEEAEMAEYLDITSGARSPERATFEREQWQDSSLQDWTQKALELSRSPQDWVTLQRMQKGVASNVQNIPGLAWTQGGQVGNTTFAGQPQSNSLANVMGTMGVLGNQGAVGAAPAGRPAVPTSGPIVGDTWASQAAQQANAMVTQPLNLAPDQAQLYQTAREFAMNPQGAAPGWYEGLDPLTRDLLQGAAEDQGLDWRSAESRWKTSRWAGGSGSSTAA